MQSITAKQLILMFAIASRELSAKSEEINRLNVFPVPDGDTGSNMLATAEGIRSVASDYPSVKAAAKAAADRMLRSARGNSGVILSVFFRGFADAMPDAKTAGAHDLAAALASGTRSAYQAVMNPTEGTILTVMRKASGAAQKACTENADIDIETLFGCVLDAALAALKDTPNRLPMLKAAGVVDAGGCGFYTMLCGMASALDENAKAPDDFFLGMSADVEISAAAAADFDARFPYCTECIIDKSNECQNVPALRGFLENIGDSVVFSEADDIIKFHVHTDAPGVVLVEAMKYGALNSVKIENMALQHTALEAAAAKTAPDDGLLPYAVVAVANGDGICDAFSQLGAGQIVSGGQTMNPSTDDLLSAIGRTDGKTVFVLPNNKNIVFTAEQAAALAKSEFKREVIVIPAKTIPQGIAALCALDENAEPEVNRFEMCRAAERIQSLSVTRAVRDANINGLDIKEGQFLGVCENDVRFARYSAKDCIADLLGSLGHAKSVTVFYGDGLTDADIEEYMPVMKASLDDDADLTVVEGGQPLYPFIIGGE